MFRAIKESLQGGRPDKFSTAAIVLGFLAAGAAGGLVIAYGKPVLMALALGGILSVVLFNAPSVAVWAVLVGSLMLAGPLVFHVPAVEKIHWLFSMLGLFLLVTGCLYGGLTRRRDRGRIPPFVLWMAGFTVYGMASMFWVGGDYTIALTGMKRYYQFYGLTFALAMIAFTPRTIQGWVKFFVVLALIQLPYVMYQRFVLVMRQGFDVDSVVGLFEASRAGHGSSGSLGFVQVIVFAGLLSAWREKLISGTVTTACCLLVLAPLALADLNVVFILLPIVSIIVFADLIRKKPLFFLTMASAIVVVVALAGAGALVWQQSTMKADQAVSLEDRLHDLMEYNFGSHGYAQRNDVNRTTVYGYWWKRHGLDDPLRLTVGHGIGSTYLSDTVRSPLMNQNSGVNINLVAATQLLWELGVVGLLLYLAMLGSAWRTISALAARAEPGFPRALTRTLKSGMACIALYTIYTNTALGISSQEVLIAMVLGLIAWASREYAGHAHAAGQLDSGVKRWNKPFAAAAPIDPVTAGLDRMDASGTSRNRGTRSSPSEAIS